MDNDNRPPGIVAKKAIHRAIVAAAGGILVLLTFLGYEHRMRAEKTIILDFVKTHLVSQIPLPDLAWAGDTYGKSYVYVDVRLPRNINYRGYAALLAFTRKGEVIDSVHLNLDDGTPDHVFAQAMGYANQWQLPTRPLEEWHAKVTQFGIRFEDFPVSQTRNVEPSIGLEIHYSFDDSKPVFISLDFLWKSDSNGSNAATGIWGKQKQAIFDKSAFESWAERLSRG